MTDVRPHSPSLQDYAIASAIQIGNEGSLQLGKIPIINLTPFAIFIHLYELLSTPSPFGQFLLETSNQVAIRRDP